MKITNQPNSYYTSCITALSNGAHHLYDLITGCFRSHHYQEIPERLPSPERTPEPGSQPPKKATRFNVTVRVILIPTRQDFATRNLRETLWYTQKEMEEFAIQAKRPESEDKENV